MTGTSQQRAAESGVSTEDLPALFRAADSWSLKAQRNYLGLSGLNLTALAVAAALFAVYPAPPSWPGTAMSIGAALLLAASIMVAGVAAQRDDRRQWYDGRAIAESVKSLAWKYMSRAEPFDGTDESCDKAFASALHDVLEHARGVSALAALGSESGPEITETMRRVRGAPFEEQLDIYVSDRLENQRRWYGCRARGHKAASSRSFLWAIGFQGLALAAAIVLVVVPQAPVNPVGALLAVAAGLIAWSELKGHAELSEAYSVAFRELGIILSRAEGVRSATQLASFVSDAETAISREHTLWIARRTSDGSGRSNIRSAL